VLLLALARSCSRSFFSLRRRRLCLPVRLAPRPCDDEREDERRVGVHLYALAVYPDLAPRDGLVRARARVGPVKLLARVDVDAEVGTVAL